MTALLLDKLLFWFRVACEVRLVSYSSKHVILFLMFHFEFTYMYILKITGHIWMFYILNNYSTTGDISCGLVVWCVLQAQAKKYTHLQLCYTSIHSTSTRIILVLKVAKKSQSASYGLMHTLLFDAQPYTWHQDSHCLWLSTIPNDGFIYCQQCIVL